MELSEFTPRTLATPARVTGCRYADGKRFHGRLRQLARVPRQHVALHQLVIRRVRVQPPAARNLAHLDAAAFELEAFAQVNQRLLHQLRVYFQHVGKRDDAHRLIGYEQQRLNGAGKLTFVQTLKHCGLPYSSPTDVRASSPSSRSSPEPSI